MNRHSKPSMVTKMTNWVKSGGYAAILLMITDMRHTRPTFFFSHPPFCRSFSVDLHYLAKNAGSTWLLGVDHTWPVQLNARQKRSRRRGVFGCRRIHQWTCCVGYKIAKRMMFDVFDVFRPHSSFSTKWDTCSHSFNSSQSCITAWFMLSYLRVRWLGGKTAVT